MPSENYLSSSMNLLKLQGTNLIHINILHSYTLTTKISKREIKEIISFVMATKIIKYQE